MVTGKYEVKGTMAFGGLGWIYLALDTVLSRWVVLKGLLNAKDPRMIEVAVKEREFLAAVKHPNIVGIYDFITHGDQGFIVMEFVNGKTLMKLRKEKGGPLPVAEAISYIVEVLPAFQYLDDGGLVYCDFKPENAMVEEDTVKLIDLGAVRQIDDTQSDVYGSKGYIAPEAHDAPTPVSDLFSVARALAVLIADFDFQGKYEHLPAAARGGAGLRAERAALPVSPEGDARQARGALPDGRGDGRAARRRPPPRGRSGGPSAHRERADSTRTATRRPTPRASITSSATTASRG